ncbi:MAG: endonuclease domain-containing protein [Rikenellaceae bacterium]|jgi:very-short-patch-repair endonuclease|nr:endonuclease domain-containing protein [Rikenellaceae bacterium]
MMKDLMNVSETKRNRKSLRNSGTSAEAVLWTVLKNRQVEGLKFRRQQGVGPYIVDFYCPELRLAIELDGQVHINTEREEHDNARSEYLAKVAGITVLRFENKEVFCNQGLIISSICEFKESKK